MNRPKEDEGLPDLIVAPGNETAYLAEGVEGTSVEGSREKSVEEAREDAAQDPSSKL